MSAYDETKRLRDTEYTQAYRDWVAKLTPGQRRKLESRGLLKPSVDPLVTRKNEDVSEMSIQDGDLATFDAGTPEDAAAPRSIVQNDPEALWSALRRVVGEILGQGNVPLTLECLALVTGISYGGDSMTSIARRHGVTRAAVSKRCVAVCDALGLPPSRAMRQLTTRRVYGRTQQRICTRHDSFARNGRKG